MKKLPVFMTALVMSLSAVMPFNAMADPEEGYLPIMYLSVEDNDKISVLPDGTVYINNQNLTGDDSIRVNIYIRDDSKSCWNIAPKIKCADANIKFNEHAVENENNAYSSPHEFIESLDEDYNTVTEYNGEGALTAALNYVTSDGQTKVYTLSGHGEQTIPDNFQSAMENQNIALETLSLLSEGSVPEDCESLLICRTAPDDRPKKEK